MGEDMDITCGAILEGTPLETVGRQIFEQIVAVASGKRSKSELSARGTLPNGMQRTALRAAADAER